MSKKALIVTRVSGFVPQFEMEHIKILQEKGYEIHYAANFNVVVYGKDNRRLQGTGIHRHHIPFERSPLSRAVFHCYKELKELMLRESFDLIHCHMPMTGVLTRKAAEKVRRMTGRRVPVIYTAHGFHFYKGAPLSNWLYYPLERHYARYTDELILINKEDYERGSKFPVRGDVDRISGVGVLPMPEETPSFDLRQQYGIPEEHKIIVSVGELTERKNHELVIRAMDRLRREKVTYVICGTGPLEKELHRMVKEMHLGDQVIFAGYCECVRDVLRQADMFAFPSRQEGLPVAVLEAMQSGLPVLAQNIRGNRDLIRDGEGGFLFEEFLPEDYVRGIRYFLKYPQEAERMGEWNRTQVKAYTRDVVDEQMKKIYDKWTDGSCL